jgi:hypothetical protein
VLYFYLQPALVSIFHAQGIANISVLRYVEEV